MCQRTPNDTFFLEQPHKKTTLLQVVSSGADTQIRTGDLILTKDALYRLSYISTLQRGNGYIIHYSEQNCNTYF